MERELPPPADMPRISPYPNEAPSQPLGQSARVRIFALAFLLTLAAGVITTLLQPAVYRAAATVLMTAPVAIDDVQQEANVQDVAIQSRVLLGSEVTAALLLVLDQERHASIDASYLREVLRVEAVADTNLVEMVAQGADDDILPDLVNAWIDVYLDVRTKSITASQDQTLQLVGDQLTGLEVKVTEARQALADYREEHDISSAERQENEVMSRLDGLNTALNKAIAEEIITKAQLQTLEKAIAQGKKVVPVSERDSVAATERELSGLKKQMKQLSKNYTMEYIERQPRYRDIPAQIAVLEAELEEIYTEGQQIELSARQQLYAAASQATQELQAELDAHEKHAAEFTTIYATHQALAEDLAKLEELNRDTQSRLVEVQVNAADKYPQVAVIDRPAGGSIRLGPDYLLWLGGSVAAALLAGILCVWLYGFLGPRREPAYVTLSGVHMYPQDVSQLAPPSTQGIGHVPAQLLTDDSDAGRDEDK